MTTATVDSDTTFLDDEVGAVLPSTVTFTGDIVDVLRRDGNPDYDKPDRPDPPKVKMILRDWAESEGREEPRLRYSKWMAISTHSRSNLSKLRKQIEKQVSAAPTTWRGFVGIAAEWKIEDVEAGQFTSQNVLTCEGKPKRAAPDPLPAYVPKVKEEDGAAPDEPDGSAEVTDDAKAAFVDIIAAADENNTGMTEGQIRKLLSQNMDFRKEYPAAFAMVVTGKLIRDVLIEREGHFFAD